MVTDNQNSQGKISQVAQEPSSKNKKLPELQERQGCLSSAFDWFRAGSVLKYSKGKLMKSIMTFEFRLGIV